MPLSKAQELEKAIASLSFSEQLWLLERLASQLRKRAEVPQKLKKADIEAELAAMAADPAIRHELRVLEREFAPTEADGLDSA
jgi:cytidylate kinase